MSIEAATETRSAKSRPRAADGFSDGNEVGALARLTLEELARGVSGIGDVHGAIARRVFSHVGRGAMARFMHDAISDAVYAGIGSCAASAGRAASHALAASGSRPQRSVSPTPLGGGLIGVIDGLIGDELERKRSVLQEPMSVRVDGRVVDGRPEALAQAFSAAAPRIVVFVHGLMGTEFPWSWWAAENGGTYASRLARDLNVTPVYVRYNTGRHISENGRSLAELLEQMVAAWPVQVLEVALIGHSMGGLVSRSACYQSAELGHEWVRRVRHVISLGSPHMGAPLAQAVHYAAAALYQLPETRPLAGLLRRRSGGIRDLRYGSLVDEDWRDQDPDALRARACKEVPLLEGATHCFIAATIMRAEKHPLSRLLGDILVLQPSASGRSRSRRIPFEAEYGMHLGPAHHLALLNHPLVYQRLRDWLAVSPAVQRVTAPGADTAPDPRGSG
jgi:pimeloyl-ACP methyl ester carboxylesterase